MAQRAKSSCDDYAAFYQQALSETLPWFKLDSDFMGDPKMERLGYLGGYPAIGMYVALMALLYRNELHIIDVSDEFGWQYLQGKLSLVGHRLELEDLKGFVGTLAQLGLVDADLYAESQKIASNRVLREVEFFAAQAAKGRAKASAMRRKGGA